ALSPASSSSPSIQWASNPSARDGEHKLPLLVEVVPQATTPFPRRYSATARSSPVPSTSCSIDWENASKTAQSRMSKAEHCRLYRNSPFASAFSIRHIRGKHVLGPNRQV